MIFPADQTSMVRSGIFQPFSGLNPMSLPSPDPQLLLVIFRHHGACISRLLIQKNAQLKLLRQPWSSHWPRALPICSSGNRMQMQLEGMKVWCRMCRNTESSQNHRDMSWYIVMVPAVICRVSRISTDLFQLKFLNMAMSKVSKVGTWSLAFHVGS